MKITDYTNIHNSTTSTSRTLETITATLLFLLPVLFLFLFSTK